MPQGLQSPLRGIRSPFGAQAGSRARRFAKGKPNVLSWAFDDPVSDMGSVWIADTVTPANNFNSSVSAAILAKFTGWSATSPMMTRGRDGTLKYANHNIAVRADDFNNASWGKANILGFGSGSVSNTTDTLDPIGGNNADFIVPSTTGGVSHLVSQAIAQGNVSHRFCVFVKAGTYSKFGIRENTVVGSYASFHATGNGTVIAEGAGGTGTITAVGNGWYLIGMDYTASAGTLTMGIYILPDAYSSGSPHSHFWAGDGVGGAYLFGGMLKQTPCHNINEYVATVASGVFHIPTTYDTSGNKLGFLSWEARTNAAWWSRDLTQSAHVKTNATAYKTARGTDNELNSASRLVATAANGNVIQSITATSAQRVSSAKVRRSKGSGTVKMSQGETTGSELVTNGTFPTDTSGWSAGNSAVLSVVSGRLRVTNNVVNYGNAYQTITTVAGKLYKCTFDVTAGTGTEWRINIGTSVGGTDLATSQATTAGTFTVYFLATSTSTTIQLIHNSTNDTTYIDFDNVSVLECTETSLSLNAASYAEVSGTELVTNGGFNSDTVWAKGTGWAISGGVATHTGGGAGYLDSLGILTPGKMYQLTVDITNSDGRSLILVSAFYHTNITVGSSAGTYTVYFTPSTAITDLKLYSNTGGTTLSIDNVSVKEVEPTQAWTEAETAAATITNPCVAIWCATSGDAIDVDHVQCEVTTGASGAGPAIITAGAAVTRAANRLQIATTLFPFSTSAGTTVAWATAQTAIAAGVTRGLVSTDTNGRLLYLSSVATTLSIYDGTTVKAASGSITNNVRFKAASAYGSNMSISVDNEATLSDVFDGTITNASLTIGDIGSGSLIWCGPISRVKYYPEDTADADLQAETA